MFVDEYFGCYKDLCAESSLRKKVSRMVGDIAIGRYGQTQKHGYSMKM